MMKVVDMHCDTISAIYLQRKEGQDVSLKQNQLHISLDKMQKGIISYKILQCLHL